MSKKNKQKRIAPEENIPLNWESGQVVAGIYEVEKTTLGGMGAVSFVKHLKWNIPLAVKTPLPEMVREEEAMKRFIREAETWVDLGIHPHITTCYYVRVLGGVPRIFIEHVDGGSLSQRIKERKLKELSELLDLAIQICRGMDYVHEKGMIHRDLKPANCLLTKGGIVKITDFGLTKVGEEIREISKVKIMGTRGESVSITGGGLGTPEYMPPEQFEDSKHIDKEADIYSFGVMLYEMVCGRRPFVMPEGMNPAVREYFFRKAHQEETPPAPVTLRTDCPEDLNGLILRCLEKGPEKRYSSFKEIEEGLLQIYQGTAKRVYSRKMPNPLKLRADALNNMAVSLLDLGREEEAEKYWEEAIKVDPVHLASTFNLGYFRSRDGREDLYNYHVSRLRGLEGVHGEDPEYWHNLALIEAEIGLVDRAKQSAHRAISLGYKTEESTEKILNLPSPLIRVFEGHVGGMYSVALTPDGRYAFSGGGIGITGDGIGDSDQTLRLWDLDAGKCLRVFEGYADSINSVAVTPDGRYALSKSGKMLRLLELETGKCIRAFGGHIEQGTSVVVTPDGRYALSGGLDNTLRLWELETEQCLRVFEGHTHTVHSVAITPNGKYALSGGLDNTLRLWELETGKCLRVFEGHTGAVHSVVVTPDGKHALSGSGDKTLRVWRLETAKCVRVFKELSQVNSISLTTDGKYALSGSEDGTLRLWHLGRGQCIRVLEGDNDSVNSVAITPNGKYALSGSEDRNKPLRLWELGFAGPEPPLLFQYIVSPPLSYDEVIQEEDQADSLISRAILLIVEKEYCAAYRSLQKVKEIPGFIRETKVLNLINACGLNRGARRGLNSSWCHRVYEGHTHFVKSVAVTPNGKYALSGSWDKTLTLWELETGKCLRVLGGHNGGLGSVALTPDGRFALSGGKDKTLRLWEVKTGKYFRVFKGHTGQVDSVAVTPDGRFALSGSKDKTLRLWDVRTEKCLRVFKGHTGQVASAAVTPDGRYALSGSKDKTLRLWDVRTEKCLRVFKEHTGQVASAAVTPDGRFALSGGKDKTLRLWELATGKCIRVFEGHTGGVTSVAITPDGRYAFSGSSDATLRMWELDWDWEFPESAEWDEGARAYLEVFLSLRDGTWQEEDFQDLLKELQIRGYGWLTPEGVRNKLWAMTLKISETS